MLKNYIKVALRSLKKYWGCSLINITGLIIGMTCSILILLWVQDEMRYDKFHKHIDNLYRVGNHIYLGNDTQHWGSSPPALGPALKAEFPEIVNSARYLSGMQLVLRYQDKTFTESVPAVDPSFLEMFSFPLVMGDSKTALLNRHALIITREKAHTYFGDENPMGKILRVNDTYDFVVTGILEEIPRNSSFQFSMLVPIQFCEEFRNDENYLDIWDNYAFRTFVQLKEGVSHASVTQKISGRITQARGKRFAESFLQPLSQIRLHWLGYGGGTAPQVMAFTLIAFFVIFIACVNFMNLTTARASNRAKEIGLRKVVGAQKMNLIKQFYGESILTAFIAFVISMGLVHALLPVFNHLSAKEISLNYIENPFLIPGLLGVVLFTGLLAGSYPALFMAAFQPHHVLKSHKMASSRNARFRKILVVVQFALSIALISGTGIISRQLHYLQNKDLGFNKEHLLYIPLRGTLQQNWEPVKHAMLQYPGILHASVLSQSPTGIYNNNSGWTWEGKTSDDDPLVSKMYSDFDLLKTFQMEMVEGDYFSRDFISGPTRPGGKVIINETFAKIIGNKNIIGSRVSSWDENYTIMGVIRDFHFKPLYQEIEPLVIFYDPDQSGYLFIRIRSDRMPETMAHIERVHQQFNPVFPFVYQFLDDDFDRLYRTEHRIGALIRAFTIVAILISCLGLFGLASYMAEQRTKEIGIRKVLGASVPGIMLLLSKEFARWVILANIIAWPLAFFYMKNWLDNFAYRINLSPENFIFASGIALGIALITVSMQTIRAARTTPVDALKYE